MLNKPLKDGLGRAATIVPSKDAALFVVQPVKSVTLQQQQQHEQQEKQRMLQRFNDRIPARYVLYFLSWSGFLVSFMMRNDINLALVVMVNGTTTTSSDPSNLTDSADASAAVSFEDQGEFHWSTTVQSVVISSFYWCYVLSQVVGGVATQYFGTKNVFGWSQLLTALCSLCIPAAADCHYSLLVILRSVQGFASGLTWPAMYAVVGYWIPPAERSRFMSSFQGFSIGIGLTYPLCGVIIHHFGWRYVFYTTGSIGVAWCVVWWALAFDTPQQHPRISGAELKYIETNVSKEIKDGIGMKVPWLRIFTSLPVWSIGVTTFGRIWVHYTFIICGPMYMKNILNFKIQDNGVLSGLPFLCSYVSSVFFCWAADRLVETGRMRLTSVRKLFTASSQIVPGVLCLAIGYLGQERDDIVLVMVIWFVAVSMITASYAGAMASIVDVAPNLAGPVLAFAQTIHMTASFVSPVVNGLIISDKSSIDQWRTVFGVAAVVATCTYLMFQVFGTSEIQPWNYPSKIGGYQRRGRFARNTPTPDQSGATTSSAGANTNDDGNDDDDSSHSISELSNTAQLSYHQHKNGKRSSAAEVAAADGDGADLELGQPEEEDVNGENTQMLPNPDGGGGNNNHNGHAVVVANGGQYRQQQQQRKSNNGTNAGVAGGGHDL